MKKSGQQETLLRHDIEHCRGKARQRGRGTDGMVQLSVLDRGPAQLSTVAPHAPRKKRETEKRTKEDGYVNQRQGKNVKKTPRSSGTNLQATRWRTRGSVTNANVGSRSGSEAGGDKEGYAAEVSG